MPADMLIYGLREPKPPFQSWNEPLINKVKTSKGVACACVWKAAWWIPPGSFHFVVMKDPLFSRKNNSSARVIFDTVKIEEGISHKNINLFCRLWYQRDQSHYLMTTQKSQQPFKSKWRTKAHLCSLSSVSPVSKRVRHWVKPNHQGEITPNIQR